MKGFARTGISCNKPVIFGDKDFMAATGVLAAPKMQIDTGSIEARDGSFATGPY